jgi:hypothetical protein
LSISLGCVRRPVEAVEVDERAEVGEVLDRALADVAGHHLGQQRRTAGVALGLDDFAAAQDHVLAVRVELHDLELVGVAHEGGEVLRRDDVDLRRRAERLDADVDDQAALDDGLHLAGDVATLVADALDAVPVLLELGLLLGQVDIALLVFGLLDEDVDDVAHDDLLELDELGGVDDALGFAADVHEDFLRTDLDDGSLDDLTGLELAVVLLQQFCECGGGRHNGMVTDARAPVLFICEET